MAEVNYSRKVVHYAIASRVLVLTLIILWRSLLSPYDTSAILNPPCLSSSSSSSSADDPPPPLLPSLSSAIEGSVVWDSVYFVRVAQCGYEYEQTYAFLPLLPFLMYLLSNSVFGPLVPVIGYRAVLALSGYFITNLAFLLAAFFFYRLSVVILKDPEASLRASILFCFNPASIFYSSIYTESLYALFSIGGLYYLMCGANIVPTLWFALSGSARSNGVLNAGYIGFKALHQSHHAIFMKKRFSLALRALVPAALQCAFILTPFLAFQAYGYYNICYGRGQDEMRPWCKKRIPLLYSFIQNHYWGVGFLRYFQLKQLPNFLLASPVLSLAVCSVHSYLKNEPEKFFSLGFGVSSRQKNSDALPFSGGEEQGRDIGHHKANRESVNLRSLQDIRAQDAPASQIDVHTSVKPGYFSVIMLPILYHLCFMTATAFFVMHVQVATRFLSASPPLYWFASYLMPSLGKNRRWAYVIWAYATTYILLGSLLFSLFYPFT